MNKQALIEGKKQFTIKDKFAFFRTNNYVYLDNAATTQVPELVVRTIADSLNYKGNPHRGAHKLAERNGKFITEARENIAAFINADATEIVFTNNTTDSINLAVEAIAEKFEKDDEILISVLEHNSNILPYHKLSKKGVKFKIVQLKDGLVDIEDLKSKLSRKTKLVGITHCSNVLGNINPVREIGEILEEYNPNIFYCIDGAQAIAHIPVDVKKLKCTFYAFSGHKMYGPDGIGVLYINKKHHALLKPVRAGGGTISQLAVSYESDGDKLYPGYFPTLQFLEGGTPNVANIIGLSKAVNFLKSVGMDSIRTHELELTDLLIQGLLNHKEIEIMGKTKRENKIGLISFSLKENNVKALGDFLGDQDICIRYGAHCAFLLLNKERKETLRISLGVYNNKEDIKTLLQAIDRFLSKPNKNLENKTTKELRRIPYYIYTSSIHSSEELLSYIKLNYPKNENSQVIIMAGHFLGIPDIKKNTFYPSIKPLVPEKLHPLLNEFGMTDFPLFTWNMGCSIVSSLKKIGIPAKLIIIVNDITGINELMFSSANILGKTIQSYREELIKAFSQGLPKQYTDVLKRYNLSLNEIIPYKKIYIFQESILRGHFKNFVRRNKSYLDGAVEYTGDDNKITLNFNILKNQDIKTCNIASFGSKTGGKYCIATVGEFLAELFGIVDKSSYAYTPNNIKNPISNNQNNILVMLSPAMCNNAVNSSAELYIKLFTQGKKRGHFQFINVPLGPEPEKNLRHGSEATLITDKKKAG